MTRRCVQSALASLLAAIGCVVPAVAEPAFASFRASFVAQDPLAAFVTEAASRFGIPEAWVRAVMRIESGGMATATSRAGAMGLMQLMPATWAALRAKLSLGADPYDPHDNIIAGAAYLRELFDRYGRTGFAAAYNAGPGRWEDNLAGRRSLPTETVRYMARLAPLLSGEAEVAAGPGALGPVAPPEMAPIFVALNDTPAPAGARVDDGGATSLAQFHEHATGEVAPIESRPLTSGASLHANHHRPGARNGLAVSRRTATAPDTLFVARTPSEPRP